MEQHLKKVFDYFSFFSYVPTFDELYMFFPKKTSKKELLSFLRRPNNSKKINSVYKYTFRASQQSFSGDYKEVIRTIYTLPQYSITKQDRFHRRHGNYIDVAIHIYLSILNIFPLVRFVGVTGASAMWGWRKGDDLDLCIVSSQNSIWTARFFCVVLAKILHLHHKEGVCLNLFFEMPDLTIHSRKQNQYIAHELLQMKPLIDKESIYPHFLQQNTWIYRLFPNVARGRVKLKAESLKLKAQSLKLKIESFLRAIQLPIIYRNNTHFYITDTQLWLFKADFEKKLKKHKQTEVI